MVYKSVNRWLTPCKRKTTWLAEDGNPSGLFVGLPFPPIWKNWYFKSKKKTNKENQKDLVVTQCWIAFHFEEYRSAVIEKKIKIKIEFRSIIYNLFICLSELFLPIKCYESFKEIPITNYDLVHKYDLCIDLPDKDYSCTLLRTIITEFNCQLNFFLLIFQNQIAAENVIEHFQKEKPNGKI